MNTTWIVTADAGRARIFADAGHSQPLQEIDDLVNTAQRMRISDKMTDRLGPTSAGQSIHNTGGALPNKTYEPAQTPAQRATEMFAKEVAQYLLKGHQAGRYREIALVASPQFLGVLRKQLDPQIEPLVSIEINKDYTGLSPEQLHERIQAKKKND